MRTNELRDEYFRWLCGLVSGRKKRLSYKKLFAYLDSIEFTYTIKLDRNRAVAGEDLRYRFGYETRREKRIIEEQLDVRPCSVFEMMVSLALTIEERIMTDPEHFDDRTWLWFWTMIENLELDTMNDSHFDRDYTDEVVHRLLNREYGPNGEGGLFYVKYPRHDMRETDIWYQAMWYLSEFNKAQ